MDGITWADREEGHVLYHKSSFANGETNHYTLDNIGNWAEALASPALVQDELVVLVHIGA